MPSTESSSTVRYRLLVALVVVVCATGATTAAAHPVTRSDQTDSTSSSHATTDTRNRTVTAHRGDVVDVALSVGNATDAVVRVTSGNATYRANVSVADANGDGHVILRWNTYLAGHGGAFAAAGDDDAEVQSESPIDWRIPAGEYTLAVTVDGERVDAVTVELAGPGAPSVRVLGVVPGRASALSSAADVREGLGAGHLREARHVGVSDPLVLELRAPGVEGALAAQSGSNTSERLANLLARDGFAFSFQEHRDSVDLEQDPIRYGLVGAGATVLADPDNDTYYVVYDLAEAPRSGPQFAPEIEAGDQFVVNLTVGQGSGLVPERRSGTASFQAVEWSVDLDTSIDPMVRPADGQALVAATGLPNGSRVTVVLDGPVGFEARQNVTVDGGRVAATFDLSSLSAGDELGVQYLVDGEVLSTPEWRDGNEEHVAVVGTDYDLTVRQMNRTVDPAAPLEVTVDATLPGQSVVVLHANESDGRVLGAGAPLEAGTYRNSTVAATRPIDGVQRVVAVVHRDVDDVKFENDPPVVLDGTPVADGAAVPATPTLTPSSTPTPTPSLTPTPSSTLTATPSPTPTDTPGFGVALALLALVTALAILRRWG